MEERRVVGYRPHPGFETLIQEVYECGHVRSIKLHEFAGASRTPHRCAKCSKGMAPEVGPQELQAIAAHTLSSHPLVARLCRILHFHLQQTEDRYRGRLDQRQDVQSAVQEAHRLLREAGFDADVRLAESVELDDPGLLAEMDDVAAAWVRSTPGKELATPRR